MAAIENIIPENLSRLWAAEDELLHWARDVVASQEYMYLQDHIGFAEVYMDCVEVLRRNAPDGERHTALCGLFLRTFDAMSHGIRAALSGNYTGSGMYSRDLLETQFLISYLMDEVGRPESWLKADAKVRKKVFSARAVREALDVRDGFVGMKRKEHYDLLSEYASHPSPSGFDMKRDGQRNINAGPLKNVSLLEGCLQEVARAALLLGACLRLYCVEEIPDGDQFSSRLSLQLQRVHSIYFEKTDPNIEPDQP